MEAIDTFNKSRWEWLAIHIDVRDIDRLNYALVKATNIRYVTIVSTAREPDYTSNLCKFINRNKSLRTLILRIEVNPELLQCLSTNTSIKELQIYHLQNNIHDHLSDMLRSNETIENLTMDVARASFVGLAKTGMILNKSIQKLVLNFRVINEEDIPNIGEIIRNKSSLQCLSLHTSKSLTPFVDAINHNKSIIWLQAVICDDYKGLIEIVRNNNIQYLYIGNHILFPVRKERIELQEALKLNTNVHREYSDYMYEV